MATVKVAGRSLHQFSQHVKTILGPHQDTIQRLQEAMRPVAAAAKKAVQAVSDALQKALEESTPPNWIQAEILDDEIMAQRRSVAQAGFPVTWVPPRQILLQLDASESLEDITSIVLRESDTILEDCESQLLELVVSISDEELTYLAESVLEAIHAHRHGHERAAQALAINVVEFVVARVLRLTWNALASRQEELRTENGLLLRRTFLAILPAAAASESYWNDPVPTTLNRHATTHDLGPDQYTSANALTAMMLATSLLQEHAHMPALQHFLRLRLSSST